MLDIQNLFSLQGKVALVTGAGTGMGKRFAYTLASAGAKVICGARRVEMVEKVAEEIRTAGGDAIGIKLDIGDNQSISNAFDIAERKYGIVDVLVNNAAQIDYAPFPMIEDEVWDNLINVNFSGTMRMSRECAKRLLAAEKPGSIINISSIVGIQTHKDVTCYGSLKAAVIQFTKQVAASLLTTGIRCNSIAPGYFITDMNKDFLEGPEGEKEIARLPLKRVGKVEELDGAVLLLASDASSFINGAVLPVDGGHVFLLPY